jgi:hypothetical protein
LMQFQQQEQTLRGQLESQRQELADLRAQASRERAAPPMSGSSPTPPPADGTGGQQIR